VAPGRHVGAGGVRRLALMTRPTWEDVPEGVRIAVEDTLGARVVSWASQPGGFSPGTADRVVLADGRRAFVKAVAAAANPDTIGLHRREARILETLDGRGLPIARRLGVVDRGDWVALLIEDVAGYAPTWARGETVAVLDALLRLRDGAPDGAGLPRLADDVGLRIDAGVWQAPSGAPSPYEPGLTSWVATHRDRLAEVTQVGLAGLDGTALVHGDLRADNVLIRPDGTACLIDWPWATVGSRWFDAACLLADVIYRRGGTDIEDLLGSHAALRDAPDGLIAGFLACLAAYFTANAPRPAVPGIPGLRAFQRDLGAAVLGWLRERL